MNMLSVLAPTSKPVDPFDPGGNIVQEVAARAAIKTMRVEAEMSRELVRLLDPMAGTRLNRQA